MTSNDLKRPQLTSNENSKKKKQKIIQKVDLYLYKRILRLMNTI